MYDTQTPYDFRQPLAGERDNSRLNWLLMENEREAKRLRLFRNSPDEEDEVLLMHSPISIEKAYALYGLLLGALPPLAIFSKIVGEHFLYDWPRALGSGLSVLLLTMSAICCYVGRRMGAVIGRWMEDEGNASVAWRLFMSLILGLCWGLVTGGAGGFPAFGIGAIFGAACAVPVGMVAFPLFTLLHRPLARGGMIDARHFWPLALGVVMVITALILGY